GDVGTQFLGNRTRLRNSDPLEEATAEAAMENAVRVEERAIETKTIATAAQDFGEQVLEAAISGDRKPLDLVLIGVGLKAEEFGNTAVEIADGIGCVMLLVQG